MNDIGKATNGSSEAVEKTKKTQLEMTMGRAVVEIAMHAAQSDDSSNSGAISAQGGAMRSGICRGGKAGVLT